MLQAFLLIVVGLAGAPEPGTTFHKWGTPLAQALQAMHAQRVGSVLVTDEAGAALGILTRHDMLDRVVLPRRELSVPIAEVMSAPVHTLGVEQRAHDAALLMSREGVRHVPITERGRVVGRARGSGPDRGFFIAAVSAARESAVTLYCQPRPSGPARRVLRVDLRGYGVRQPGRDACVFIAGEIAARIASGTG